MASDLLLGLDCSTSACKAVIFDPAGRRLAEGRAPLSLHKPHPGWHEQDPADWSAAACDAIRAAVAQVDPARLAALSFSIQRETFVPVDANGAPLRPALLWMDTRAAPQLPPLAADPRLADFQARTGKRLSVNLAPPRLRWLAQQEPAVFGQAAAYWDVHAALAFFFAGQAAASWGSAGPMGLLDLRTMDWCDPVLQTCGIHREQLPRLAAPGSRIGTVSQAAAAQCGLPVGLPVVAGIGDGQACGLGAGITQPGRAYLSLGTSVISGTFSPTFAAADAFRTMVGGLPGTYLLETVLLGGTYTIDWLLNDFLGHPGLDALEALSAEAALLPPGAEGLVLLPYWNSAMNPHWDAHARGAVIGWRGSHRPAHLLRAILEGIAFELRLQLEAVENALGTAIRELALMGGGSRSRLWCQVIADVCNRPAVTVPEPEAAALGAAMLAAAGVGIHANAAQAAEHMRPALQEPAFQPDAEHVARYDDLYRQVYRPLYPALRGIMGAMARLPSAGPD